MDSGITETQIYKVNITGKLNSGIQATSQFTLTINLPYPVDPATKGNATQIAAYMKKVKNATANLKAQLSVDTNGVAKITFSKSITSIQDLNLLRLYGALSFKVNPKSSSAMPYPIKDWNATSLTGNVLKVQLIFPEPSSVSVTLVISMHSQTLIELRPFGSDIQCTDLFRQPRLHVHYSN